MKKDDAPMDPCYSNVPASKKLLNETYKISTELEIHLPHQLNHKVGESVSVVLDGKVFHDVLFVDGVYKIVVPIMNFSDPMLIVISRGSYKMNSTFAFTSPASESSLVWILTIISVLIILCIIAFLVYRKVSDKEKVVIQIENKKDEGKVPTEKEKEKVTDSTEKKEGTDKIDKIRSVAGPISSKAISSTIFRSRSQIDTGPAVKLT